VREIKLPPLRQPVIAQLSKDDAAFTLNASSPLATTPAKTAKSAYFGKRKRFPFAFTLRYDKKIQDALDYLCVNTEYTRAALIRHLIRVECARMQEQQ